MAGDTAREAISNEVKELRRANRELKQVVAETVLQNRVLKKSLMVSCAKTRSTGIVCYTEKVAPHGR